MPEERGPRDRESGELRESLYIPAESIDIADMSVIMIRKYLRQVDYV